MSFGPKYVVMSGEDGVTYTLRIGVQWTPATNSETYPKAHVGGVMQLRGTYSGEEASDGTSANGAIVIAEMDAKVQELVNRLDAATVDSDWNFSWSYKNEISYQDITPDED